MITASEIKSKTGNIYAEYLKSIITNESFFPKIIRSNKSVSSDFNEMRKELAEVIEHSKDRKGFGYTIIYKQINTRKHGIQSLPEEILFQTEIDFLKYLNKEKEAQVFREDCKLILSQFFQLKEWIIKSPLKVVENHTLWMDLLKVCNYFVTYPNPRLYVRELPIDVHTKFVEENVTILRVLLDTLIEEQISDKEEKVFEKRFGLKSRPAPIRMRILDRNIATLYFSGLTDIVVTEDEVKQLEIPCLNVFITENEMSFLTLPAIENTIAFFGKGFGVIALRNVHWLANRSIYYWGDMDVHGFQILSQLRTYFPHARSIMMNVETYGKFKDMSVYNQVVNAPVLSNLNTQEMELYNFLKENNKRLEQEKITYAHSLEVISKI